MSANLERRIERLEQAGGGYGDIVIVYPWQTEQEAAREQEEALGRKLSTDVEFIHVEYVGVDP